MTYQGSKYRFIKNIAPIINNAIKVCCATTYVEPFCGSAAIATAINCEERLCYDINNYLITLLKEKQKRTTLPVIDITKDEFLKFRDDWKAGKVEDEFLAAYIGYFYSFNGVFFRGGYCKISKGKRPRNYFLEKLNSLNKMNLDGIKFECKNYKELNFKDAVIYCDPPYKGVEGYFNQDFNPQEFENWCDKQNENDCIIFLSEFTNPNPEKWSKVWSRTLKQNLSNAVNRRDVEETLFIYKGGKKYE